MKKLFRIVVLALAITTIVSSCSNEAEQQVSATAADSTSGPEVKSVLDSLMEAKREELIQRAQNEVEKIGKKIMDLGVKQKTAEAKVNAEIIKEIEELKNRNERLGKILLELREVAKEKVQEYEKQILELIKD